MGSYGSGHAISSPSLSSPINEQKMTKIDRMDTSTDVEEEETTTGSTSFDNEQDNGGGGDHDDGDNDDDSRGKRRKSGKGRGRGRGGKGAKGGRGRGGDTGGGRGKGRGRGRGRGRGGKNNSRKESKPKVAKLKIPKVKKPKKGSSEASLTNPGTILEAKQIPWKTRHDQEKSVLIALTEFKFEWTTTPALEQLLNSYTQISPVSTLHLGLNKRLIETKAGQSSKVSVPINYSVGSSAPLQPLVVSSEVPGGSTTAGLNPIGSTIPGPTTLGTSPLCTSPLGKLVIYCNDDWKARLIEIMIRPLIKERSFTYAVVGKKSSRGIYTMSNIYNWKNNPESVWNDTARRYLKSEQESLATSRDEKKQQIPQVIIDSQRPIEWTMALPEHAQMAYELFQSSKCRVLITTYPVLSQGVNTGGILPNLSMATHVILFDPVPNATMLDRIYGQVFNSSTQFHDVCVMESIWGSVPYTPVDDSAPIKSRMKRLDRDDDNDDDDGKVSDDDEKEDKKHKRDRKHKHKHKRHKRS